MKSLAGGPGARLLLAKEVKPASSSSSSSAHDKHVKDSATIAGSTGRRRGPSGLRRQHSRHWTSAGAISQRLPWRILVALATLVLAASTQAAHAGQLGAPLSAAALTAEPEEDARLSETERRLEELTARIDDLTGELSRLRAERDRLRGTLTHFESLYGPLEADRLLLMELRKELPEGRAEAEAHLHRLRRLALAADPVRLGPIATRVMEAAPVYLDWRDREFATEEAAARDFVESGAGGFSSTFVSFRNAILLTVSNRIDGLLNQLDRIR